MSAADRPAVVLLHSSASSGRQWAALAEALQPYCRVRLVDLHGHGARPAWQGAGAQTLADDAELVAPLLADGGAHVVGHSYGGAVALKLACLHPRAVRSLVAFEPVMFRWLLEDDPHHPASQDVLAIIATIRNRLDCDKARVAAECFVSFWSGQAAWTALPEGARGAIAARMPTVLAHFDALTREPLRHAQLAGLGLPMLFASGAATVAATRRMASLLRATLPHATHLTLPGMGHMGPVTHAAAFNRQVVRFLRTQGSAQRVASAGWNMAAA
jgi:pimeloyl-ACP methyl ester carboxylesterase